MTMIDRVLTRPEFDERPPVLVDIGAASRLHRKWRPLARYSICIAFDPDQREMDYVERQDSRFRRLIVVPAAVTDQPEAELPFHLTRQPQCSSLLEPNEQAVAHWAFADYFEVERTVMLRATRLSTVLDDLDVEAVDWFKTDSQGTDVRLFLDLSERRQRRVLAADFEPGILDAYRGEDKLHHLMAMMEERGFWLSDLRLGKASRIHRDVAAAYLTPTERRAAGGLIRPSPGWAVVTYLNSFRASANSAATDAHVDADDHHVPLGLREHLLGWVFATLERQHGFALELAHRGRERFGDPLFNELTSTSTRRIRRGMLRAAPHLAKGVARRLYRAWRGV